MIQTNQHPYAQYPACIVSNIISNKLFSARDNYPPYIVEVDTTVQYNQTQKQITDSSHTKRLILYFQALSSQKDIYYISTLV
jgi:hypothetical protein